ncbi:MAG: phosphocholine cytidylyltransferase family protein [Candidatus Pacearchaeota archaeon]|nr:phosphocholine cytidylyltransferase family protein [Candidatus Pacearchaeota archaeon]
MKGLILAAGIGNRLYPVTKKIPKCLIKVGKKRILEHILDGFDYAGIKEVIIIVGFNKEKVKEKIGTSYRGLNICYGVNDFFKSTNNLYSLWCAKEFIDGPFIQCHGDIIPNREIIKKVLDSPLEDAVVIDSNPKNMVEDANRVKMQNGKIIDINKILLLNESAGRAFGIYKFSKQSAIDYYKHIEQNVYKHLNAGFEIGLRPLLKEKNFQPLDINGYPFAEIDTISDLKEARKKIKSILEYDKKF